MLKRYSIKLFIGMVLCSLSCLSFSQSYKPLSIGDQMPSEVWSRIPRKKNTELVILDFWTTGCSNCMEAFPKMLSLQEQFKGRLQVALVNAWEEDLKIKERMDKMNSARLKKNLKPFIVPANLLAINGDTVYQSLFTIGSVPHHIWLDSSGKVLYMTQGYNATPEHVQAALDGEKLNLALKDDRTGAELLEKGYLQALKANMPPIYYSAFIPHYSASGSGSSRIDSVKGIFRKSEFNESVIGLFKTAFQSSGQPPKAVLEMKNPEQYNRPEDGNLIDDWNRKYSFTYELQGPIGLADKWQKKMQEDVNYFFGERFGLVAIIEKRKYEEKDVEVLVIKDKK